MVACFPHLLWPFPALRELIQAWRYTSLSVSCLILSGAAGVTAVSCSLSRCGAARGSPSSLQHSPSWAPCTCLSSAGPLSKKTGRGISSAKHFARHPSVSSTDKASKQGFCQSSLSDFILFCLSHPISDSRADFLLLCLQSELKGQKASLVHMSCSHGYCKLCI